MKQIYTLFCSFTLFILDFSMFNVINSSKKKNLKTVQEFSRMPENIKGQQDIFQESRTKRVLIANSRTILGAQGRLATLTASQTYHPYFLWDLFQTPNLSWEAFWTFYIEIMTDKEIAKRLQIMLFFLLLMLLFRSVCHQVSNQADKLDLLAIFWTSAKNKKSPDDLIYLLDCKLVYFDASKIKKCLIFFQINTASSC